jgi:hypothetical protein
MGLNRTDQSMGRSWTAAEGAGVSESGVRKCSIVFSSPPSTEGGVLLCTARNTTLGRTR